MHHQHLRLFSIICGSCLVFGAVVCFGSPEEALMDNADQNLETSTRNLSEESEQPSSVTLTQVVFRNGDRSPLVTWPNDENTDNASEYFGQMTMKGKRQCFELGQWLHSRYENTSILQSNCSASSVYIRSADADRCLQCASAVAAGMLPPKTKNDRISLNIDWQPVSIHSVPDEFDRLLSETLNCAAYHRTYAQLMQTALFRQLHMKSKYLFGEMSKHTGLTILRPAEALLVRDAMRIHESNNKTLSDWAKSISHCTELDQMYHIMHRASTFTAELARLRSGFMLKEILDRASAKSSSLTVYMYSTHGSTITNLMNTLRIFTHQPVPYTASLLFETAMVDAEPHLRILYRYEPTVEPLVLSISDCGARPLCPVRRLYEIFKDVLPDQPFEAECAAANTAAIVQPVTFMSKVKRTWTRVFG